MGDFRLRSGMGYAILRVQKLKAAVAVQRSAKHNYREQSTPNANPALTPDNTHHGPQNVAELMDAFNARMPDKHRKDAVQCIEVLVTGSPETMAGKDRAGQDAYLADALDWIKATYGPQNVVGASVHRDESTPHLVAYIVPVDDTTGRLNAKKWLGGATALAKMQTDFGEKVGKRHGLERGQERSKASHTPIRQFYAEMEAGQKLADQHATITPAELAPKKSKGDGLLGAMGLRPMIETPEGVAQRLTAKVRPIVVEADQVHRENKRIKAELVRHRKEANGLRAQVATLTKQLAEQVTEYAQKFGDLTRDQLRGLVVLATQLRRQNVQERQADEVAKQKLAAFDQQKKPRSRGPGM